jgi:hypothetical protein
MAHFGFRGRGSEDLDFTDTTSRGRASSSTSAIRVGHAHYNGLIAPKPRFLVQIYFQTPGGLRSRVLRTRIGKRPCVILAFDEIHCNFFRRMGRLIVVIRHVRGVAMNPIAAGLRRARLVHACFLIASLLDIFLIFRIQPVQREVSSALVYSLAFECVVIVGLAISLGRRKVRVSEEKLRNNPEDPAALGQWLGAIILLCAFAQCIVLFGFVLKFLGADWRTAGPFFALGIFLMLLWTPRLDVPSVNQ